jgi:hypothetical protein
MSITREPEEYHKTETQTSALKKALEILGPRAYVDKVNLQNGLNCIIGIVEVGSWPPKPKILYSAKSWKKAVAEMEKDKK